MTPKKASEIFRDTHLVFGKKVSFKEAFPLIAHVRVEVAEIGHGARRDDRRVYNEDYLGEYIDCSNPACYNGGFSIGAILRDMVHNKQADIETSKLCQGNEASAKGRRIYRKCVNLFKIKVHIDYKDSSPQSQDPSTS